MHSISCSLEYEDMIYYALKYVFFDFIYNKDSFLEYEFKKPPHKYLMLDNKLYFKEKPFLKYRNDFNKNLLRLGEQNNFGRLIKEIETNNFIEYSKNLSIMKEILNKDKSLASGAQISLLKNKEYDKYRKRVDRIQWHYINIFDIDNSNKECLIIDKQFSVKSKIKLKHLQEASKIESKHFAYYIDFELETCKKSAIIELIVNNMRCVYDKFINIDETHYYKNVNAVKEFINDFEYILITLNDITDGYVSQYISYPLIKHKTQRKSIFILYKTLYYKYDIIGLKELVLLLEKSAQLWVIFDALLDKIYLKKIDILAKQDKLKDILNEILVIEEKIIEEMNRFVQKHD